MRKTKLQLQISVDGYMAGPNGEMDWLTIPWTDDLNSYVDDIWKPVDTIVLGRSKFHRPSAGWTGPGFMQFSGVTAPKCPVTRASSAAE